MHLFLQGTKRCSVSGSSRCTAAQLAEEVVEGGEDVVAVMVVRWCGDVVMWG